VNHLGLIKKRRYPYLFNVGQSTRRGEEETSFSSSPQVLPKSRDHLASVLPCLDRKLKGERSGGGGRRVEVIDL